MAYVNLDLRSKINAYGQRGNNGKYMDECAGVCGCMLIKTNPENVPYPFLSPVAQRGSIAGKAGKTSVAEDTSSLEKVLALLQEGYPVIARIKYHHWVVIYSYHGLDSIVTASNFRCIDPWGPVAGSSEAEDCYLTSATGFQAVNRIVHFR